MKKLRIFISYAHADNEIKELFVKHLDYRVKARKWEAWDDTMINPGDEWDKVIRDELKKADAVILLVTADFFGSKYINEVELLTASEKVAAKAGRVIPVKVAPCSIDDYLDISKLQWINIYDDKKFEKTLEKAQLAANEKATANEKAAAIDFAADRVIKSLEAYAKEGEEPTDAASEATALDLSLKTLRELDPDALLIVVRDSQKIYLLPPGSAGAAQSFPISEQWLPHRAFAIIQRLVAEGVLDENEYEALGEAFFYRLFPQKQAQDAFKNIYLKHSAGRDEDNPLKIILHFDRASTDLASLPWEYLWLPFAEDGKKGFFIGEKAELVLTRRLSTGGEKAGALPPVEKIRILIAFSKPPKPDDRAPWIEGNAKQIEAQCQALSNIEIKREEITSEAMFKKYIAENGPFQIVHFIGKGRTENEKKEAVNEIAFFDPKKKEPEWLSPERFAQCFEEKDAKTKKPNLFFFNVIRKSTDFCGNLRDTALRLIDKVDGVLSIQTPADSEQCAVFAEKLYSALGQGKDLDVAAATAARAVVARQIADKKENNISRMYGISAAYSRKTLRMEVAKPKEEQASLFAKNDYCPNYYILDAKGNEKCTQKIKIGPDGEPMIKICPGCGTKLSVCPNPQCRHLVSLDYKVCYLCAQDLTKPTLAEHAHDKQHEHDKPAGMPTTRVGGFR